MDRLSDRLEQALSGSRDHLITSFRTLLSEWIRDLGQDSLRFWFSQLNGVADHELPVTLHGVAEARRLLRANISTTGNRRSGLRSLSRRDLGRLLWDLCEWVFAYSREDDLCEYQGQYFYYFFLPGAVVFKASELGACDPGVQITRFEDEVRVATISELKVPDHELL